MSQFKTPDIYYQENSQSSKNYTEIASAIPAFIGFTEKTRGEQGVSLLLRPIKISNIEEYQSNFGYAQTESFTVTYDSIRQVYDIEDIDKLQNTENRPFTFYLHQAIEHFFENGGSSCYVVSIGGHDILKQDITSTMFLEAIDLLQEIEEISLLSLPECALLDTTPYYVVQNYALQHCKYMKNRIALVDVLQVNGFYKGDVHIDCNTMREELSQGLNYGATYYPYLYSTSARSYRDSEITVNYELSLRKLHPNYSENFFSLDGRKLDQYGFLLSDDLKQDVYTVYIALDQTTLVDTMGYAIEKDGQRKQETPPYGIFTDEEESSYINIDGFVTSGIHSNSIDTVNGRVKKEILYQNLKLRQNLEYLSNTKGHLASLKIYNDVKLRLSNNPLILPPSAVVAGMIAKLDETIGVWKAPANIALEKVMAPVIDIDSGEQEYLNYDPKAGKSINAIRRFIGKGTRVWGSRTLTGNDNEWRYINVRRLFNMIEQTLRKTTQFAVFDSNTPFTWLKIKVTIENYLEGLWQQGALLGTTPDSAFFVNVGLGQTMTQEDINNGLIHVEVGLAAVRPAEFIILTFSHNSL
ncbi:phage tail sheath family protein [Agarilytica rhodophyticola]|uniref:phage tail sheath family protein n=1 Tax=Agarilytica rhodophyticola TaxID=1737490 RepID=UPI001C1F5138|nr:phage tail sheath C-terminal domain-containing protein [Agarilytica rhodophyticola]